MKINHMNKKNIVLVGFMGTGKTVTGQRLSDQTGMELVDMDSIIEERAGRAISKIFATDGEAAFRILERDLAHELSQREGLVISTGGGIVLNSDNVADFEKTGLVICLKASPEVIFQRVEKDATRPLLAGDKKEQIKGLLEARLPLYNAIAHGIDTENLAVEETVEAILKLYTLES